MQDIRNECLWKGRVSTRVSQREKSNCNEDLKKASASSVLGHCQHGGLRMDSPAQPLLSLNPQEDAKEVAQA